MINHYQIVTGIPFCKPTPLQQIFTMCGTYLLHGRMQRYLKYNPVGLKYVFSFIRGYFYSMKPNIYPQISVCFKDLR